MARLPIVTYLNDHLSGSEMALEVLDGLHERYHGHPQAGFFAALHKGIAADRRELEQLMRELGIGASATRKATAWMAEKLTALKLRLEDPHGSELRMLESLEILSLGIEGKRSLWLALRAAAERSPALRQLDYDRMIARAEVQRDQVEEHRIAVAERVLVLAGKEDAGETQVSESVGTVPA